MSWLFTLEKDNLKQAELDLLLNTNSASGRWDSIWQLQHAETITVPPAY